GLPRRRVGGGGRGRLRGPLRGVGWAPRPGRGGVRPAVPGLVGRVRGRSGTPRADERPAPPVWKPLAAGVTVIAGLAVMANVGVVGAGGGARRGLPWQQEAGMVRCGVVSTTAGSGRSSDLLRLR